MEIRDFVVAQTSTAGGTGSVHGLENRSHVPHGVAKRIFFLVKKKIKRNKMEMMRPTIPDGWEN